VIGEVELPTVFMEIEVVDELEEKPPLPHAESKD
jgi:hypothetical protein